MLRQNQMSVRLSELILSTVRYRHKLTKTLNPIIRKVLYIRSDNWTGRYNIQHTAHSLNSTCKYKNNLLLTSSQVQFVCVTFTFTKVIFKRSIFTLTQV